MDIVRLVQRAKRGRKEALMELILAEKDTMYRLAFTYMGNQHDAMDVLEEMIVRLYENIGQLKKEEAFYSWSKTILVNICKTTLRKQKKLVLIDEWHSSIENEHIDANTNRDDQMEIAEMLSILNENQREAIKLKYLLDLDYQSIAEMTSVPLGTVKSRIYEGLRKLKDHFGGEGNERDRGSIE